MEENVIQIKSGITINVHASVKNIYVKKNIFGILLHVVAKILNMYVASIIDNSVITFNEEETKIVTTSYNEKKQSVKQKISILYMRFY